MRIRYWSGLRRTHASGRWVLAAVGVCAVLAWPPGSGAVFSGSNGLIAYDAPGPNGQVGIWTASPAGSDAKEVMSEANAADDEPVFSPDGQRIAFVNGSGHVAVMNADGANVKDLTPNDAPGGVVDGSPSFSPDGSKIVFSRLNVNSAAPEYDIWVMNASTGSGQQNLTAGAGIDSIEPSFSPDGSKIAFVRGNPEEIWTMGSDGSSPAQLSHTDFDASDPSWSPDGGKLVFSFEGTDLYLIDANGSDQKQLTNTSAVQEEASSWSPDGTKIVSRGQDSSTGAIDLYLVDPTGGTETELPHTVGADHPDWQARPVQRTLTIKIVGGGHGRVTSTPSGIRCSSTCSGEFSLGTQVTLMATAARGTVFEGWTGTGCSGRRPCFPRVSRDESVTADFETRPVADACGSGTSWTGQPNSSHVVGSWLLFEGTHLVVNDIVKAQLGVSAQRRGGGSFTLTVPGNSAGSDALKRWAQSGRTQRRLVLVGCRGAGRAELVRAEQYDQVRVTKLQTNSQLTTNGDRVKFVSATLGYASHTELYPHKRA